MHQQNRGSKLLQNEIDDRRERMQRVRVGLTGLAVVLLLVVLANVANFFFKRFQDKAPPTAAEVVANDASQDEPLSDLGIVPRAPDNSVASAKPAPAPAP
jgi:hypothetical protein